MYTGVFRIGSTGVSRLFVHPLVRLSIVAGAALSLLAGASAPSHLLSPLTSLSVPFGSFGIHTWLHFFGYATFGIVLAGAFVLGNQGEGRWVTTAFATVAGYGVAVELLRLALPYRTFSTLDITANVFGAFVGVVAVWIVFSVVRLSVVAHQCDQLLRRVP